MHSDRISHSFVFFLLFFLFVCFLAFSFFFKPGSHFASQKGNKHECRKKNKIYMLQRVHSVQTNTCVGYKTNKQTNKQKHLSLAAQFRSVTTYEEEEEVEVGRVRGAGPPSSHFLPHIFRV